MRLPVLKLHTPVECRTAAPPREPRHGSYALRWLSAAVLVAFAIWSQAATASAQTPTPTPTPAFGQCPPSMATGQPFFWVPEIAAADGKLRGTVMLGSEERWIPNRIPISAPTDQSKSQCFPQFVRYFWGLNTVQYTKGSPDPVPYAPKPTDGGYPLPQPGPTLRARVGNLVQLAFINQINPSDFGDSIDRGETGRGGGCDETSSGYPGGDKYPDCFHGSSTGNIHFHGTHTNPNTTGDNVFIEVRPSLREGGRPIVTPNRVDAWFNEFYARCEQELNRGVLREWPTSWADMPKQWTDEQANLLQRYDAQLVKDYGTGVKQLWPVDKKQIEQGAWPQYYIGAFPYCFRLPEYTSTTWPPPTAAAAPVMGGSGTAEAGHEGMSMGGGATTAGGGHGSGSHLRMGQSPGTHWYHAHKHGSTAINVSNGMTGAFIIEGQYDDDLNKWYGAGWTRTQPLMIVNQLGVSPNLMRGPGSAQDKGPDFSVNGRLKPVLDMRPGEVQMWRIVNTSGRAAVYFEGLPAGFEVRQLAQDGVQFKDTNYKNRHFRNITVASGNRVDLLVKAPPAVCATAGGCKHNVLVKNMVDPADLKGQRPAQPITLFTVNVTGTPVDPKSNQGRFIPDAPAFPKFLDDIADHEIKGTKTLTFASTGQPGQGPGKPVMHTINHKKFDGEVGEVVLLNTAEEWKIVNESYPSTAVVSHPFHIHINPFQVTDIFDPNQNVTVTIPDPKNRRQTTTVTVPRYVFDRNDLDKRPAVAAKQCLLDPFADRDTWKPCGPAFVNKDNIWWDVFPIPSGRNVTTSKDEIDPTTKQPVIDSTTKKPKKVVVNVPGWFKMRSRFVDFPGFYVLHCHILAHEDRGMMTIVEVAPARTPYSHN